MKFYIHRLGCPKNDVDAEYISARLIDDGHAPVSKPEDAETIIVNTCGFILPAREESISELLRLAELKKDGHLKTLYASGCLSQRHGDELLAGL
ncbi:MAG: 30S ribosomal protein S12 methylthiotransferase RimO, partial [Candidatus Zixiibacteriota bacterium]